jgi:CheY-like chemotaxis protein
MSDGLVPALRPVLYVEDDENDVILFRRALTKIHSTIPLQVITDGQVAWDFLTGKGASCRPPVPSLILLDLKLPNMSGIEILSSLKSHEALRRIPVIVMTSSTQKRDIERVYDLGADFYLAKRTDFNGAIELAEAVDSYWVAVREGPDALGSDPTLHRLRRMSEPLPKI